MPSTRPPIVSESSLPLRAIPKSVIFAPASGSSRMFCGLTSRWTIPRACAASSARADLDRDRHGLGDRQAADALDALLERLALDVLEDDEGDAVVLAAVEHADDVRVAQARDRARLAAEALDVFARRRRSAPSSILIATRRSSTVSNASQTRALAPCADLALRAR